MMMKKQESCDEFTRIAMRVSGVCMLVNAGLCLMKLAAGLLSSSKALVSDGINSAFDVVSGVIVIIGARLSRRNADTEHPYGHERFESVATVVLAVVLFVTAVFTGHTAIEDLTDGAYRTRELPGALSMAAALVSMAAKEILYWYTKGNAEKIGSLALKAEAWDHRADVIATAGALLGIMLTRYGVLQGDLFASLFVCLFIVRTAYKAFREAMGQMVDKSCGEKMLGDLRECVLSVEGVSGIDLLRVRMFGNKYYVDLEISEDGAIPLYQAHAVAEQVHDSIESRFPDVKHIMVHVNPAGR